MHANSLMFEFDFGNTLAYQPPYVRESKNNKVLNVYCVRNNKTFMVQVFIACQT